ncbi:MAG: M20 family metallopeptidase [Acidimicrobiia bacterium]|nr:M20 family metallopeptidase [Acidimicrobiia bacterium]
MTAPDGTVAVVAITVDVDLDVVLADLRTLVEVESPSLDLEALRLSAAAVAALIKRRLGSAAEIVASAAGPHVHWRGGGAPRVLVVGHHDTVFPLGTLLTRPFTVADGRALGPGVFDMKGGIVLAVHAVAGLADPAGVELLFTADEEVGSGASRALIEERAQACGAVLVLEPAGDGGAIKIGRKGTGGFEVVVHGRAAHAGLEPEKGVNALVEAAHQVLAIAELGRPEEGTTVTPTVAVAGTADNVVPAQARVRVDLRVTNMDEGARVEAAMVALRAVDGDAVLEVHGGMNRPPMETAATAELYALACQAASDVGLDAPPATSVGGGSDGNFTAALGIPTLDGLGVAGGGAHADHEFAETATMVARTTILRALITRLQHR